MTGEFCVFLIGMRINRPWKIHRWLPVAMAMPRMLRELEANKELGLLGSYLWLGRTIISVQYWRSTSHLTQYAASRNSEHLPAWTAFTRAIGDSGDVGIWHETYAIRPGSFETIYHNMPPFGLGRVATLRPATGGWRSASGRMQPAENGETSGVESRPF